MKTRTKIKLLSVVVLIVLAGAGWYFFVASQPSQNIAVNTALDNLFGWKYPVAKFPSTGPGGNLAYSSIRDPGGIPQGLPVRLQIPVIGVDSTIEDALITPDGRMDVPFGSVDVAWFSLGPHPGQVGSAVIGGHFGIKNGVKFVFYDLDKLQVGDKIYIIDDGGATLSFIVRSISSFNRNDDATTVFTSSDGIAHLNLITCEGVWNQVNGTYPKRLVVFTDAVQSGGAAPVTTTTKITFPRSLSIGARGADVVALQSALVEKGLLTMPYGIAKGFFGALTGSAVARYQTRSGLPSVGTFGPLTRAKLTSELATKPILPNAGTELAVSNVPVSPQNPAQVVESMYATPLDGVITSLLLLAIIIMTYIII